MSKERKKFKDTKFGQLLTDKAPHLLDIVGDVLPDKGLLGVVKNIIDRDERIDPQVKLQLQQSLQEFEKEMFALEIQDKDSARNREIETVKAGRRFDLLMNVTGFVALGLLILTVIAVYFFDIKNKDLAHFIAGEMMGVGLTIVTYYFGSSKGSADKTKILKG